MTKESGGKKREKKNLQPSLPQAVEQEEQKPSPQSPEDQVPIPGVNANRISPEILPSRLNFLLLLYLFFFFVLSTLTSLFSYPYSYPLHFLPFSFTTIYYSLSQLLFLPLLIHSFPRLHLPLLSFLNLSSHYLSLLHTHHSLTSLLY
jgi:hypothetical protein